MTTKIKLGILALTSITLLILTAVTASRGSGLSLIAPFELITPAFAQTSEPPPPEPLVLTDGQGEYPLGMHLEILGRSHR